jgi:ATP-dependent Clp protease protease subunit
MKKSIPDALHEFCKTSLKETYYFEDIDVTKREIYFGADIDDFSINKILHYITLFEMIDDTKSVTVYLNSGGGDVTSCLLYYDTLQSGHFKIKVDTIVRGICMSAATVMLMASTGKKSMTQNSSMMFHQISNWSHGKINDERKRLEWIESMQDNIIGIYSKHSNVKTKEEWEDIISTDTFYSAEESKKKGMVDEIIKNK